MKKTLLKALIPIIAIQAISFIITTPTSPNFYWFMLVSFIVLDSIVMIALWQNEKSTKIFNRIHNEIKGKLKNG